MATFSLSLFLTITFRPTVTGAANCLRMTHLHRSWKKFLFLFWMNLSIASSLVDTDPTKVAATGVVCTGCSTCWARLDAAWATRGLIRYIGYTCEGADQKKYVQDNFCCRIFPKYLVPHNKRAYRRCHRGWAPQWVQRSSLHRSRIRKGTQSTGSTQSQGPCRTSGISRFRRVGLQHHQSSPGGAVVPYSS